MGVDPNLTATDEMIAAADVALGAEKAPIDSNLRMVSEQLFFEVVADRDAALARTVAAEGEEIKLHQYWRTRCVAEAIRATAAEERLARKDAPLVRATRGRGEPWR